MDTGIIVDIETTGLDSENDKIIEIGIVEFQISEAFEITMTEIYGAVEDPKQDLDPQIQELTGLSNQVLAGKSIDWEKVKGMFQRASVVIAHNMEFDRSFLIKHPALAEVSVHWACSMKHIDWDKHGFKSRSLNYLAADHGFINPFAHRAVFDCATTFRLMSKHLKEMVERSYEKEVFIKAVRAPFESKDLLKARRYRWDPEERVWGKIVAESQLVEEREFLANEIYSGNGGKHQEVVLT